MPKEERVGDAWLVIKEVLIGVVPLAALIGFTLGTILGGLATPTEAASCGAFGATLLALLYRRLTFKALKNAAVATMVTSSMVLLLAVSSNVFGAVFTKLGTASVITDALVGLPLPDIWKLALIMFLIFVLGWPFEWPAIMLVFLPIFLPVVEKLNFGMSKLDMLIWFGALVAVNLQTAFLSPPVAMSAYYLKNVVPQWSLSHDLPGHGRLHGDPDRVPARPDHVAADRALAAERTQIMLAHEPECEPRYPRQCAISADPGALRRYCCKSRKSSDPENLAKVDRWTSLAAVSLFKATTEVPGRFWIKRCGLSRRRSQNAPAALNNFVCPPKKTFATVSSVKRTSAKLAGYTSVGAGTSLLPVRLNCPPEITLHTLRDGQQL